MTILVKDDSLTKRYFFKLFSGVSNLIVSLVVQMIVPRSLGPRSYGDYTFLTNSFTQILSFFDMGTSVGFYTMLSKRPREFGLVLYYFSFSGLVALSMLLFVIATDLSSLYNNIWPKQTLKYIYLVAGWGIITWMVQVFLKMTDAYGLTVQAETARVVQNVIALITLLTLFTSGKCNLVNYLYYQYFILLTLIAALLFVIWKNGYLIPQWKLSFQQIREYTKKLYVFSHPLFVYAVVGMFVGFLDGWILQVFGGSVQQGFLGLSYQIGAVCLIFTSAVIALLVREFSIAFSDNDHAHIIKVFSKYAQMLYFMTACLSCFIAVQAGNVVYIFGGKDYNEAVPAVTVMALFPIHQSYGQINSSVFYATERTRLYRNIGIFFMLIGLPVTYCLLAPKESMGLNMGATGLAIKLVVINVLWVNVLLFYNIKLLKLSYQRFLIHQVLTIVCLLTIATISTYCIDLVFNLRKYMILNFILSCALYTVMVVSLVYLKPAFIGFKKQDLQLLLRQCPVTKN